MNLNLKTVEMESRLYNNTAFKVSNEPNGQCVVYVPGSTKINIFRDLNKKFDNVYM